MAKKDCSQLMKGAKFDRPLRLKFDVSRAGEVLALKYIK